MTEQPEYTYRLKSWPKDIHHYPVLETEIVQSVDPTVTSDSVLFVRGGGTRHMCPVCSNAADISRMSVYFKDVPIQIYWCPKGHIYYAYQGFVGPLAMVDEINAATDERRCPICGYEYLSLDTQTMMEDYGENWELVLTKLQASNPDIIPYICASCRQEGSLEDFKLMAGCDDGD